MKLVGMVDPFTHLLKAESHWLKILILVLAATRFYPKCCGRRLLHSKAQQSAKPLHNTTPIIRVHLFREVNLVPLLPPSKLITLVSPVDPPVQQRRYAYGNNPAHEGHAALEFKVVVCVFFHVVPFLNSRIRLS
jgi:hypothetical protein